MKTLEQLTAELAQAVQLCERYTRPTHAVRNCPSDLEHLDDAWRQRQRIEYQINLLKESNDHN